MIRLALLLSTFLCLQACVSHPTMTITKDGQSTEVLVAPLQPIVGPDGIQLGMSGGPMDWVDFATYKSMGALPPPPPRQPVWLCHNADVASTGLALSTGMLAEANPLGIWALPVGIAGGVMARRAEERGDTFAAKFYSRMHCGLAAWNVLLTMVVLL